MKSIIDDVPLYSHTEEFLSLKSNPVTHLFNLPSSSNPQQSVICLLYFQFHHLQMLNKWNYTFSVFADWFVSISIVHLGFIFCVYGGGAWQLSPFSSQNNIPLSGYTTVCSSIHLLNDIMFAFSFQFYKENCSYPHACFFADISFQICWVNNLEA